MKWIVEYTPEIHEDLQKELDKEYEKLNKYTTEEIKPQFNRNRMFAFGIWVVITDKIKEKIRTEIKNGMLFRHKNIRIGLQEIEFKSYIDILPGITKNIFKKMLTKKVDNPLKKTFGSSIISVKEFKDKNDIETKEENGNGKLWG